MRIQRAAAALAACTGLACQDAAPPRPQLVIVVDTDLPVLGQIGAVDGLSPDAAVDTLRIDALAADGTPYDVQLFTVGAPSSWPLSFGVAASASDARFRLRLFRGAFAAPGTLGALTTLEPEAALAVDRLVAVPLPDDGIARASVLIAGDCWGIPSSYFDPPATCVDAASPQADPHMGVHPLADDEAVASVVGTWAGAQEVSCESSDDRRCIPGGFAIVGDADFANVEGVARLDSTPLRPALVSPFLLDRTEFTVGRFRTMVNDGRYDGVTFPGQADHCTWAGATDDSNDDLPLNCITWQMASALCALDGGALPSEAAWEYAARGRGERRTYPWGETAPTCCMASASRSGPSPLPPECDGDGIEPVGSHPRAPLCLDLGDVSVDGVMDLAGSLGEATLDGFQPFTRPCWTYVGVPRDPVCVDATTMEHTARGGSWNDGLVEMRLALRNLFIEAAPTTGFRCAYPVGG
jgi:formylglycine-generating enzyme required for sulfatase activity